MKTCKSSKQLAFTKSELKFEDCVRLYRSDHGRSLFNLLAQKWQELPGGLVDRVRSVDTLLLDDRQLRDYWEGVWFETTQGPGFTVRGWYQTLYKDTFRGARVLEIGSGLGIDGLYFLRNGACWHFTDIVSTNLALIQRLLHVLELDADGLTYISDLSAFEQIPGQFDFIYCQGSMINAPFEFAAAETASIIAKLKPGGRWIELCYPKERWVREGCLPPSEWAAVTDGEGTPWIEWYDLDRLQERFGLVKCKPILAFNFHNNDFNWFDLRIEEAPVGIVVNEQCSANSVPLAGDAMSATNGATVTVLTNEPSPAEVKVTTCADQWGYSLVRTLYSSDFQAVSDAYEPAIAGYSLTLEIKVLSGAVGVSLNDNSLSQFIGSEIIVETHADWRRIKLLWSVADVVVHLVIRNVQGGSITSEFIAGDLRIQPLSKVAFEALKEIRSDDSIPDVLNLTALVRRHWPNIRLGDQSRPVNFLPPPIPAFVRTVKVQNLAAVVGCELPSDALLPKPERRALEWKMEIDDAPILAYLYRHVKPRRHLEFGTWEGFGSVLVAENSDADIWTINLPGGEYNSYQSPSYSRIFSTGEAVPSGAVPIGQIIRAGHVYQTDAGAFIGRQYREAGFGSRVHQILADSRQWDDSEFSDGFFDSILIDGGHQCDTVINDTEKAIRLLRPGGLMLWHDFHPTNEVMAESAATRGVVDALHQRWNEWSPSFSMLFWIAPSFLLVGVKS